MKKTIYRIITVDDEEASMINLKYTLASHPDMQIIAEASNASDAIKLITEMKPDIVFLDVKLPTIDGFGVLDAIKRKQKIAFEVIFLTGWADFAIKAIKYAAFDFLLKPVDPEELSKTLDNFRRKRKEESKVNIDIFKEIFNPCQKLRLPIANGYKYVNPDDIIYIEGDGAYSNVFCINTSEKIEVCHNLKYFEDELASCNFLRIHKACMINKKYLSFYNRKTRTCILESSGKSVELQVSQRLEKNINW